MIIERLDWYFRNRDKAGPYSIAARCRFRIG